LSSLLPRKGLPFISLSLIRPKNNRKRKEFQRELDRKEELMPEGRNWELVREIEREDYLPSHRGHQSSRGGRCISPGKKGAYPTLIGGGQKDLTNEVARGGGVLCERSTPL